MPLYGNIYKRGETVAKTKHKKRIQKQKKITSIMHNNELQNLTEGFSLYNSIAETYDARDCDKIQLVKDSITQSKFSNQDQVLEMLGLKDNLKTNMWISSDAHAGIQGILYKYANHALPVYIINKLNLLIRLFTFNNEEYRQMSFIKATAPNKINFYVYKKRVLPSLVNEEKSRKKKYFDTDLIYKEIHDNLNKFDEEKGLKAFINSLDPNKFIQIKEPDRYTRFPYLLGLLHSRIYQNDTSNHLMLGIYDWGMDGLYFKVSNWDLFKIALKTVEDRDVIDAILKNTSIDFSNKYSKVYNSNIDILENYKNLKNTHPYTYKFIKSSISMLIALNQEHKLISKNGQECYRDMPMVYTSLSYIAKKIYIDKDVSCVKPNLSRKIATFNFLGILSTVPISHIPNYELAKAIKAAKDRNTLNITNFYSLANLKDDLDIIETRASFAYENGLRIAYKPKEQIKEIYQDYAEYLKNSINRDNRNLIITELNRLRDVMVTNFSPITIYDACEYLRNRAVKDFLEDTYIESQKHTQEFDIYSLKSSRTRNILLMQDEILARDSIMHTNRAKTMRFNCFYTHLHEIQGFSNEYFRKILEVRYINSLYISFGNHIDFPCRKDVDKRLCALNILYNYRLKDNSTEEDIESYDICFGLLDKYSYLDYYRKSPDPIEKIVDEYYEVQSTSGVTDFILLHQLKTIEGSNRVLTPYVNYSSDVQKAIDKVDKFVRNNYKYAKLQDLSYVYGAVA